MIILLNTSKTMRRRPDAQTSVRLPLLSERAERLGSYLRSLDAGQLATAMHISPVLAAKVHQAYAAWSIDKDTTPAIDCFIGDIYSGFQAKTLSLAQREYADAHVGILSGLYGYVRPLDDIMPYRLELLYKLPDAKFKNLYAYWGGAVAECVPADGYIINAASAEYSRLVLPFINTTRVITPEFLTVNPTTGVPTPTTVHTKIARGALAHWLVTHPTEDPRDLCGFDELGYRHDAERSTAMAPVYVCQQFGGIGLSVRLEA